MNINELRIDLARGIKSGFPNMSFEKIKELTKFIDIKKIAKKEIIIKRGLYYGNIVMVIKGLFRAYYKKDDIESTFWFREENTIFASHQSILAQKPSMITYQAIEPSIVGLVNYKLLKQLAKDDNEVATSIIVVLEALILELIIRVEEFTTLNAEERYNEFQTKSSKLIGRVPQRDLAAYLGITPVSLSRLKSRIQNK